MANSTATGLPIVTYSHSTVSMSSVSATVLAANSSRTYALFVNDGTQDMYLNTTTAVANRGIRINAGGGNFEMAPAFGNLMTGALYGIVSTGTHVMLVTEGTV